jgi:transcriptional regulator with XRE-family HTH domain
MSKRIDAETPEYGPHFIREWRKHRGLSQDRLVERVREDLMTFSKASLSRIENRAQPYSQPILEALARALRCTPADLLMRNPMDTEAPWSIWETLKPAERRQAVEVLKALKRAEDKAA